MKVNLSALQTTIFLLLERLKANKGNDFELKNDYFWAISSDDIYNVLEHPKIEEIGQLSFDLEEIAKIQTEDLEFVIGYHLECVANIIRAIGIENPGAF